ncbi:MAG: helix-turn-helix transcriptional regulator [Victivallales bacterium]|nr:helix-turn-helix transcriptional regulator [Victivallales bacterium]
MKSASYKLDGLKRLSSYPYPLYKIGVKVNHFVHHDNFCLDRFFICFSFNKEKYNSAKFDLHPTFSILRPGTILTSHECIPHDELYFSYAPELSERLEALFHGLLPKRQNRFSPDRDFRQDLSRILELLDKRMFLGVADRLDALAMQMTINAMLNSSFPSQEECVASMKIQEAATRLKEGAKLPSLLRELGFSHRTFYYEWKKNFSISPKQFQLEAQLEKAQSLLQNSTLTIQEIALQCNFSSYRFFHNCFQKSLLCTPGEYRKVFHHIK